MCSFYKNTWQAKEHAQYGLFLTLSFWLDSLPRTSGLHYHLWLSPTLISTPHFPRQSLRRSWLNGSLWEFPTGSSTHLWKLSRVHPKVICILGLRFLPSLAKLQFERYLKSDLMLSVRYNLPFSPRVPHGKLKTWLGLIKRSCWETWDVAQLIECPPNIHKALSFYLQHKPGIGVQVFSPGTWEVEAGGWVVSGHPQLHSKLETSMQNTWVPVGGGGGANNPHVESMRYTHSYQVILKLASNTALFLRHMGLLLRASGLRLLGEIWTKIKLCELNANPKLLE